MIEENYDKKSTCVGPIILHQFSFLSVNIFFPRLWKKCYKLKILTTCKTFSLTNSLL